MAITYGTALSAAQLNAIATAPGTILYSPSAGTVMNSGTQILSATFTPSDASDYVSVTQTVRLTVNPAAATIAMAVNPNPAAQGKTEVVTATVTSAGQPTGTVVFTAGSTNLCTATVNTLGMATCSFVPSTSGALTIGAQYGGDQNHSASVASLTLNVFDSAVQLQLASAQIVYPEAANVKVCVSGLTAATPTGTVALKDGTTLLTTLELRENGCVHWHVRALDAGAHSLIAVYSGDRNNAAGSSAPIVLTVSPAPVNMSQACRNPSFDFGANYDCNVNLRSPAGPPQGVITYSYDGRVPVSVPLNNGDAQFTIAMPGAGKHTVTLNYPQQTNYAAAPEQVTSFTVAPAPVHITLTPSNWDSKSGANLVLHAAVSSWSAGSPNSVGTVTFYDGSSLLQTVPVDDNGRASYSTANLQTGTHAISATYAGTGNYASGSSTIRIKVAQ